MMCPHINNLNVKIRGKLGELKGIENINFSSNKILYFLPSCMSNLLKLEALNLSRSVIIGTVPPQYQHLSNAQEISFNSNRLIGTIPLVLISLINLK